LKLDKLLDFKIIGVKWIEKYAFYHKKKTFCSARSVPPTLFIHHCNVSNPI